MGVQNTTDRTETGQTTGQTAKPKLAKRLSATHADYWKGKLRKRTSYGREGQTKEIPEWQVRLFHAGKEGWFNLATPNADAAAPKARDIFVYLRANGWDATNAKFKVDTAVAPKGATVGELLNQVKAVSGLKPVTFEICSRKFRTLVAGVFKINGGKAKHDYVHGGHKEWLGRVHAVRLDKLTPERVNKWKVRELESANGNPLKLKRARVTLRSILLCSKALFSESIRKHLTLKLPKPLPFEGVTLPEAGKSRYKSEINPSLLLQQARRELAEGWQGEGQPLNPRPELYKAVLLALGAGLRRDEIDKLTWHQIKWDRNIIRVETTEHGGMKSADSEADVDVDPGLLEILKGYIPEPGKRCSQFVIESPVKPRPQSVRNHHYRCNRLFKELIRWLRSKGVTARTALHSLRKEFGSQICKQGGIYAASVALRHSTITITRDYYLDKKQPVVLEIGKLLNPPPATDNGKPRTERGAA
jgi:integrase